MNRITPYILFLFSLFFTSCIPSKDLIYLQENNKSVSNQPVESVALKPYRLQINDILNIKIKAIDPDLVEIFNVNSQSQSSTGGNELSNYFNGYSVDDHGNIRLPILGEVNVLGRTLEEVTSIIEGRLLKEYFNKEAGIFAVVKLAGFRYTINGEVVMPGTKVLYQDRVNLMEAVANAGDITVTGDRKNVKVIRRNATGSETFSVDLTDANAIKSPAFNLQPNDYILVNPLKQKTWGTGKTGIESLSTVITILSLATTTFLLLRN
ncbi:polysaccharide biosynthesis/export family protein [Flavobacterium sp.]|uniref:polysaccharide biosynthesis/export family protein n=1 Tax=Flavobacterium sp. TaxID=239 RepID=UPI0025F2A167|nr:polysaccharide biosynthesis/export family protein [Flavobacterium sp.]